MLPGIENIAAMVNNAANTFTQFAFAPANLAMSLFQGGQRQWDAAMGGGQFPEGVRERRDTREARTPADRLNQEAISKQRTEEAGIYVYVPPGATAQDKGTIIF